MTDASLSSARLRNNGPVAKWRSRAIGARLLSGAAMLVQASIACAQPAYPRSHRMDQLPAGARLLHTQSATVGEPERRIVGSMAEWDALWISLHGGMPAPPLPSVDFSREVVAFATMGTRSTGGFELDIAGTRRIGKDLDVLVIETVPAPGCMLTQVESTPTVAVRVPRAPGVVRFSVQRKTQRC